MALAPFANEPTLELRRAAVREELLDSLRKLDRRLPLRAPTLLGGESRGGEELLSTDPGEPERIVALAPRSGAEEARAAVDVASASASGWAHEPVERRAEALLGAARWMRERRGELAALCVRECGKPWLEADADVAEAIDFLEYYARRALALQGKDDGSAPLLLQAPGERNTISYRPRGVCAVIAPWNFPLAIPTGMSAAALVSGNSVVLKPAEQAPGCGAKVAEALRAGGVPADVLCLLQGEAEAGAALVADERVQTIAFTGSARVGVEIMRAAAEVRTGQRDIKRVIAEMGGKNCVLIDSDADLDEAVPAIVTSAFAYAGQKCSAASRLLVHESIASLLGERLAGAVQRLRVGQAEEFGVDLGPLIERQAAERLDRYREVAEAQGAEVVSGAEGADFDGAGWFRRPLLVSGLPSDSEILREEIFAPLLAFEAVKDLDAALERVDELPFALTGGLFCRDPHTVERVAARMPVGNLYVNRHITGAMVARHPFGGNRLSGSGFKAGGPDYLLQFMQASVLSENVMRHGLVVS
ncbi:MAG TPA: aldehyde dehydrogenase family protein [Solirubrobacteraceae bacterium]|jgi:RHH-type proline utilization regulon transcriptional repressor/proline dehydrogenase/delta 1-pyrroline-5-carboxylate dehydrogenase